MRLVEATHLTYGTPQGVPLITDLSFHLCAGEKLTIRGANGVGKSTLLRVVLGKDSAMRGQVRLNIAKNKIAYLPQLQNTEFHIPMTLRDVLRVSLSGGFDAYVVQDLGLLTSSDLSLGWNTASGGERQKTLLTRTFLQDAHLMVLDEPMNHLDQETKEKVRHLISGFVSKSKGRSVLMVSHEDSDTASHDADKDYRSLILGERRPG